MTNQPYTHTVYDNTTKTRKHFFNHKEAVIYANKLLVLGHKVRIRPYKRYIDIIAARGPDYKIKDPP